MNCKNCHTVLEEGVTLCPNCGTENAETAAPTTVTELVEPAKPGLGAGKIALLVVLAVAAIAVIVALVMSGGSGSAPAETTLPTETLGATDPTETLGSGTVAVPTIPADGNPDDVTCKGTYSVTDEEMAAAASTVVATMGDTALTNTELQIYYWMQVLDFLNQYAGYASMFGLDYTQPLDTQLSIDGTLTWQQYFLDSALNSWTNYQAMAHAAVAAGYELDEEYVTYLEELPATLEQNALSMGFENADAMIQADMGPAATLEGYLNYLNNYYLGYMYYGSCMEQISVTEADVEAYFDAHAEEYKANGLEKTDEVYVDVRHILISPESAEGASTYTDAEWAAAKAEADRILNEWLSKTPDEDSFADLAETYSQDPGSASNGGLYEDVYVGQMVEPFENWCFDASRQYGDYGIVETSYGYHIMFFVGSDPIWYLTAESDMLVEKGNEFLAEVLEQNPAQIDYSAIALGTVDLASAG